MNKTQIVTVSFFRFKGWEQRWWALRQMGFSPKLLSNISGLQFAKMLGSGSGNGFSVFPNWGVYGLLCTWESEQAARHFFAQGNVFKDFVNNSAEQWTIFLRTTMAHGQWDGVTPFEITTPPEDTQLVGVITRATIHTKSLLQFWRFVPRVSRSVENKEGLLFSIGIGELPIIQQATFSLWQNSHLMKAYAYRSAYHREVVQKTRERGWYKEELFVRFLPFDSIGTWQGENPLQDFFPA